ncbi:hypothetical protein OH491_24945 [Termitidicoccus mucosus]|uniref:Uncharacterized protein n=1 Tax=Termitidicoccus mucosus TaxID=1184151 RepID=A0A178IPY2_9BACT|nr:hypothetical protein AW736_01595 [Opitutaceae bacterium TSB47]
MSKTFIQLSHLKQAATPPHPLPQSILLALVCEAWPFVLKAKIKKPGAEFHLSPGWEKTAMEVLGQLFTCFEQDPATHKCLRAYMAKWKRGRRLLTEDCSVDDSLKILELMQYRKLKYQFNHCHPKAVSVQQIPVSVNSMGRLETGIRYGYPRDGSCWHVTSQSHWHLSPKPKGFHKQLGQHPGEAPGQCLKRMIAAIETVLEPMPDREHAQPHWKCPAPSHALVVKREKIFEHLREATRWKFESFRSPLAPDPQTAAFFGDTPTLENQTVQNVLSSLIAEFYTGELPPVIIHMLILEFQKARKILHLNQTGEKFLRSMKRGYGKLHGNDLPGPDYTLFDQCKKAAARAKCKIYLLLPKSSTGMGGLEYIPLKYVRINRKEHCLYRRGSRSEEDGGGPDDKFDLGEIRLVCCAPASWELENPR